HGDVGAPQQLSQFEPGTSGCGDADARINLHGHAVKTERLAQHGTNALADCPSYLLTAAAEEYGELVATQPDDCVLSFDGSAQPTRHLDQELIAVVVAEAVVDFLEPVQVEKQ